MRRIFVSLLLFGAGCFPVQNLGGNGGGGNGTTGTGTVSTSGTGTVSTSGTGTVSMSGTGTVSTSGTHTGGTGGTGTGGTGTVGSGGTGTGGTGTVGTGGTGTGGTGTVGTGGTGTGGTGTVGTGSGVCVPLSTMPCYSGPAGTQGVGICVAGAKTCDAAGSGFGPCVGEVLPQPEACGTPVDDDCNGLINDGCVPTGTIYAKAPGGPTDEEATSVAVDGAGNALVAGFFYGGIDVGCGPLTAPGTGQAGLLWKLAPDGSCLWSKAFGKDVYEPRVAVDAAGNVYVTGHFQDSVDFGGGALTSAGNHDVFIAKYDAGGAYQWAKRFGDAQGQYGAAIAVDAAGSPVVVGYFAGTVDFGGALLVSTGAFDVFAVKLDTAGNHLWSKRFGDANVQMANAVALDAAGNIVIAGKLAGTIDFGGGTLVSAGLGDVFVAKLAPSGGHLWSRRFGDNADQGAAGVAVDASGNIVLTGSFAGTIDLGAGALVSQGSSDAFLARLNAAGTTVWARAFGGALAQDGVAVAIDPSGNIGLAAKLDGSANFGGGVLTTVESVDTVVAKYTSAGAHLSSQRFGGPNLQVPLGLAVDQGGHWHVAGYMLGAMDVNGTALVGNGAIDMFVLKLAP